MDNHNETYRPLGPVSQYGGDTRASYESEEESAIGFEIRRKNEGDEGPIARKDDAPLETARPEPASDQSEDAPSKGELAYESVKHKTEYIDLNPDFEVEETPPNQPEPGPSYHELLSENRYLKSLVKDLRERQHNEAVLGKFMELMRWQDEDNLRIWAERLLNYLVPEVGGISATMYTVDWEDENARQLRFLTGFAHGGQNQKIVPFGRGLIGQVALTKRPFMFGGNQEVASKVPSGILSLAAGYVYIYPLLHNGEIQGTIELVSLNELSIHRRDLLLGAVERFGTGVHTLRNQLRVERLYEEAAEKSRELQQRESELNERLTELNRTQAEMRSAQEELANLNAELEARVAERTQKLQTTLDSLQNTQDQLVLSEKMAALGQLFAGVAHEINSPIGAIKASAATMADTMAHSLSELPRLYKQLDDDQVKRFDEMLTKVLLSGGSSSLSSRDLRKLRKRFESELDEQGAKLPDEIASDLTGAGFTEEITPYMDLLTHSMGPQIGRVLYGFGQLRINLDNINLAVDKTKKVVFALKSYAYSRGENVEKMEIDLAENIDTVLTIYHNQLKYGINLTKNLAQLPPVKVYADELAQVWTNILQNGIQAMKGEGDLLVELYQEGNFAVVAIQDSGEGIPHEHQKKIFEPFFTTKKQGEGTGLGLDICKKIIEKHGGDIRLTSEPGRTRFEILLPL